MSHIIGTFRIQADTDLVDVLPDAESRSKNRNVPGTSGGDDVDILVISNAGDAKLINPDGVIFGTDVTQAAYTIAAKVAGGADRPSGTIGYSQLRGYRIEGTDLDITFTLIKSQ